MSDPNTKDAFTSPPIERLPPELLAAVFSKLAPPVRTLCGLFHQRWRLLIKGLWPELITTPRNMLKCRKLVGTYGYCVLKDSDLSSICTVYLNQGFSNAAWEGHIDSLSFL